MTEIVRRAETQAHMKTVFDALYSQSVDPSVDPMLVCIIICCRKAKVATVLIFQDSPLFSRTDPGINFVPELFWTWHFLLSLEVAGDSFVVKLSQANKAAK